jgi:ABC-type nitrate/sulfonate/bicarbonate transport system substrate-binding protein
MGRILLLALTLTLGVFLFAACGNAGTPQQEPTAPQPDKIRIGWQTQWATQGQLVKVWQHTNIMKMNGLEAEYSGVDYGPKLNPLAIAGDLDVFLTADQPAAAAFTVGARCKVVGRLMYNNTKVYVPLDSPIQSMSQVKSAAGPTGAAAERITAKGVTADGGDPLAIDWITLGMAEQGAIILQGKDWPADAIYGFDAAASNFIYKGHARELYVGHVVSVVVMCNDFMENNPDAAYRFVKAFYQGWYWYATHQQQANSWFKDESRLPFDLEVLDIAASVEPNIKAQSIRDIRPFFNEDDLQVMQEASDFVCLRKKCGTPVVMTDFIDLSLMERAHAELSASYDPELVKVTN